MKIAEKAADLDLEKIVEIGTFGCLVLVYKSGIDIFQYVIDKINPIEGVTDAAKSLWDEGLKLPVISHVLGFIKGKEGEPDKEVKYKSTLSQEKINDIIDEALNEYLVQLFSELKKWKLAEVALETSTWSAVGVPEYHLWMAEKAEITRLENLQIWLNANKYLDGQRPGGSP